MQCVSCEHVEEEQVACQDNHGTRRYEEPLEIEPTPKQRERNEDEREDDGHLLDPEHHADRKPGQDKKNRTVRLLRPPVEYETERDEERERSVRHHASGEVDMQG